MGLILLNLQSNKEIYLDEDSSFVIGRGKLTGCADKRVSRTHGRITCTTDGKISLQALHTNPCFFTRKGSPPVMQLNKDEEQVLNEGDCLGLLPHSFWYQVITKSKIKKEKLDEAESSAESQLIVPKTEVIPKEEVNNMTIHLGNMEENRENDTTVKPSASKDNKSNEDSTPAKKFCKEIAVPSCSGENSNLNIPPHLRDTCKLPVWMYEIKGQKEFEKTLPKRGARNAHPKPPDIDQVRDVLGVRSPPPESPASSDSNSATTNQTQDNNPDETNNQQDNSRDGDGGNSTKPKPGRPYCRYEADCYRKNAQHKLEYSHPGDEDYVPYENRLLCEYGASCYRKNLSHRRQYRHVANQDSQTPQTSVASDAPTSSTSIATDASTQDASSNTNSKVKGERRRGRHKRKRRDTDRSSRSCHLSVTVSSASPKHKRRRNSRVESSNHSSSEYSFDDSLSTPDPFSDDYSSEDYFPTDDSIDDDDDDERTDDDDYFGKDYLRDFYF